MSANATAPGWQGRGTTVTQATVVPATATAPRRSGQLSRAIIATYYGKPPRTSYFDGCSMGGREAMLLAQRYPHDFESNFVSGPPLVNPKHDQIDWIGEFLHRVPGPVAR
ncbi:tannase/feruloyl esterase family alpha/beta hydrolase [Kribbella pittospori]|uniref:tannase/feruloyl esterase family alpha/beta hydrolase n=1 Tax=Kribbella pittospori TaxID=722689 RepID=UPI00192DD272|nr:tannase/feruloyl esterase family alpha/beta hydrolase [Kribbella pittospori]